MILGKFWGAIRAQFHAELSQRLREELEQYYNQVPIDITQEVLTERRQIESFLSEIREVTSWLTDRGSGMTVAITGPWRAGPL